MHPTVQEAMTAPEDIFMFVNSVFDRAESARIDDQRISERTPITLPVQIDPLTDEQDQFEAVTKDISVGGLGLISPKVVEAKRMIVRFPTLDDQTVSIAISYQRPVGPFVQIGGNFEADWTQ